MNNFALEARCRLALSRVLAPFNPEASVEHLTIAQEFAVEAGFSAHPMCAFISSEKSLTDWYEFGKLQNELKQEAIALNPPVYWCSEWRVSDCGLYETKAVVARFDDGYAPGLVVSHQGGEADPVYASRMTPADDVIAAARQMQINWHLESQD